MGIEVFRDWAISVSAIAVSVGMIVIIVLALGLYRKVRQILNKLEAMAGKLHRASDAVNEEYLRPILKAVALFQGVSSIRNTFRKKKEAKDGRATG